MEFVVNGVVWRLQFVNRASRRLRRSDGSRTIGVSDNNLKTVFIADNLSPELTEKVLIHELSHVHAMEYRYIIPIEVEEIVCDFLSLYGRSVVFLADEILGRLIEMVA